MHKQLYELIPKDKYETRQQPPLNLAYEPILGKNVNTVFIENFEKSLRCVDIKSMSIYQIGGYLRQMSGVMETRIKGIENAPRKHVHLCIKCYRPLRTLMKFHVLYLINNYESISKTTEHQASKGWSQASLFFLLILFELKLMNSMECIMRQVKELMYLTDKPPDCLKNKTIPAGIIKKIMPPSFIYNVGNEACMPACFLYIPSENVVLLKNFMVTRSETPLKEYSQIQLYVQWRRFAERIYYTDAMLDSNIRKFLWNLLGWTAEIGSISCKEESGRLDMGNGYVTKSRNEGIMEDVVNKSATIVTEKGKMKLDDAKSKSQQAAKQEKKVNGGEEVVICGPYFYGEICEMFALGLNNKTIFKNRLELEKKWQPKKGIETTILVTLLKKLADSNSTDAFCDKIFINSIKAYLDLRMNMTVEPDFIRNTAEAARVLYRPPGTTKVFENKNDRLPPRDTPSHEETWYGYLKMSFMSNQVQKSGLNLFKSSAFTPSVMYYAYARCLQIELLIFDRDFDWINQCYLQHCNCLNETITHVNNYKYPVVLQLDKSLFIYNGEHAITMHSIFEAIAMWLLYVSIKSNYKINFGNGFVHSFHWLSDFFCRLIKVVVSHTDYNKSPVMQAFVKKFSDKGKPILIEEKERFEREIYNNSKKETIKYGFSI